MIVIFALWCARFDFGRKVSAAVIALITGAIFSNIGLLPHASRVYELIVVYLVPFAVALLLFKANLRQVVTHTGGLVFVFLVCVSGTVLGAFGGFLLLPLGSEAAKLLGVFIATYTGGSMNFVAVSQALEFNDGGLLSAALASEAIVGTGYLVLLALTAASTWFMRQFPPKSDLSVSTAPLNTEASRYKSKHPGWFGIALVILLASGICWFSFFIAQYFSISRFSLLFITLFAVLTANLMPRQLGAVRGDFEIGMFLMYVFFVVVGAGADISILFTFGPVLMVYAAIICLIHVLFTLTVGKLFRFNYAELITASNACILGPAPAAALAAHHKWHSLVTPALLCGILGYVIANFIGVSVALRLGG
ncbi:MAG: DUF819 family protein [Gammaproteobacteria bacterium]|nr:DUF819 family protein [Gammaproteobacteria bacterium]MDE0283915.1 DUF819 family protein [Gammaproteobacteria bacterium]